MNVIIKFLLTLEIDKKRIIDLSQIKKEGKVTPEILNE